MTVPDCRTLAIESENRVMSIEAEGTNQSSTIPLYGVPLYGVYHYGIDNAPPDDRTLSIESCKDGG